MTYEQALVAIAERYYEARREEFRAYESEEDWAENMARAGLARQDIEDELFAAVAAHRGDGAWWQALEDGKDEGSSVTPA